ncbi:hypothetical protein ACFE04_012854 [Oxalis oulophora]
MDTSSLNKKSEKKLVLVQGPIIIGAGPSGLATAACLYKNNNIPSLILEKSNCIASLWQHKTYNRLKLHLPKQFCQLPLFNFPKNFPKYPTKQQFISYLESYAQHFNIKPRFNQTVKSAEFDSGSGFWRVTIKNDNIHEYLSKWLVVASGENAEPVVPDFLGMGKFHGPVIHTSVYKSGCEFKNKKVLVIGCGNSANFTIGNTDRLGLRRPKTGPLELKNVTGKTPVLDVGALSQIRSGKIKITEGVKEITRTGAKFMDGQEKEFDCIILATGYKSNVPTWLKGCDFFTKEGMPKTPFPNGWKGEDGLYTVGFTKRGLLGTSSDAVNIAQDIAKQWRTMKKCCNFIFKAT